MVSEPQPDQNAIFKYFDNVFVPVYEKLKEYAKPKSSSDDNEHQSESSPENGTQEDSVSASDIQDDIHYEYSPDAHNQIRMAYTHMARDYVEHQGVPVSFERALSQKYVDALCENQSRHPAGGETIPHIGAAAPARSLSSYEMARAADHVRRAALDAKKTLYYLKANEVEKKLALYNRTPKDSVVVDGSFFLTTFYELYGRGRTAYRDAKVYESLGLHDRASAEYTTATDNLDKALQLVTKCEPQLEGERESFERMLEDTESLVRKSILKLVGAVVVLIVTVILFFSPDFLTVLFHAIGGIA